MSRLRPQSTVRTKRVAKIEQRQLGKQLRVVLVVAVLFAAVGGVLAVWDSPFAVPPARLVQVYRMHGCRCVFGWAKTLESEGFVVRLYEYETLRHVRTRLHMPEDLHGCHVGTYLGYFVEGHVSSQTLRWLAQRQPQGRGVAVKSAGGGAQVLHPSGMPAGNSTVLFYNNQGAAQELSDG